MSATYDLLKDVRGLASDAVWHRMIQHNGRLRSSRWLPAPLKAAFANRWAIKERSEIALTVASMYSGGDYFEFGSESFTHSWGEERCRSFSMPRKICAGWRLYGLALASTHHSMYALVHEDHAIDR
jgi:hypothetical protein